MNGWTMELLEDSSIKDALSLIDPSLADGVRDEIEGLAHTVLMGPQSALTENGVPFVTVAGDRLKAEGAMIGGATTVTDGRPIILTQDDVNKAAINARDAWLFGAKGYRKSVCERAGTGAHVTLVWRKLPHFLLWSDWGSRVCIAMSARLAFETLEDGEQRPGCASSEHNALAPSPQQCCPTVDFFAINKAFSK